jgi:transcriptional regulator GlxA family with amidase domain
MNVGIYIYDNAEVLDFSGPFEVFATANRLTPAKDAYHVCLIGETGDSVSARAGFNVTPHYSFQNHPGLDILIVAGGIHHDEMAKPAVLQWLYSQAQQADIVASVCTGAFLLAEAGVLSHQKVTTHWEDIPELRSRYPSLRVIENQRWVDDGNIITSAGISAGIDMSLHLVGKTTNKALAERTSRQMEYVWTQ